MKPQPKTFENVEPGKKSVLIQNIAAFRKRSITAIRYWLFRMPAPISFLAFIGIPTGREDNEKLMARYREFGE